MEEFTLIELEERFQIFNRAANKSAKTLEWYKTSISRYYEYLVCIASAQVRQFGPRKKLEFSPRCLLVPHVFSKFRLFEVSMPLPAYAVVP